MYIIILIVWWTWYGDHDLYLHYKSLQ